MGCEICQEMTPEQYERCQILQKTKRNVLAPCGGTYVGWGSEEGRTGSNYTPPKKKRKKQKSQKQKHGKH